MDRQDGQDGQDKKGKGLRRVNLELGMDSRRGAKNAKIATRTRTQNLVSSIQYPESSIQNPVSSIQYPVSSIQNLGIGNGPRITRMGTDRKGESVLKGSSLAFWHGCKNERHDPDGRARNDPDGRPWGRLAWARLKKLRLVIISH